MNEKLQLGRYVTVMMTAAQDVALARLLLRPIVPSYVCAAAGLQQACNAEHTLTRLKQRGSLLAPWMDGWMGKGGSWTRTAATATAPCTAAARGLSAWTSAALRSARSHSPGSAPPSSSTPSHTQCGS